MMSVTSLLFCWMLCEWALYLGIGLLVAHLLFLTPSWGVALAVVLWMTARVSYVIRSFTLAAHWGEPIPSALRITPARRLACMTREWWAVTRSFSFLQPLAHLWAPWAFAAPRAGTRPVALLVHGAMCNASVWSEMRRMLDHSGFDTEFVNLPSPARPIAMSVPLLDDRIEAICKQRGIERLTIITHSMGGLALRAYIAAQGDARLERVITIAAPHQGSRLASLSTLRAFVETRVDSNFLKALRAKEASRRQVEFICVFSHHDNLVAPACNAVLPGSRAIAFSGVGHVSLLHDARVLQQVALELRRPMPTNDTASANKN